MFDSSIESYKYWGVRIVVGCSCVVACYKENLQNINLEIVAINVYTSAFHYIQLRMAGWHALYPMIMPTFCESLMKIYRYKHVIMF